MARIVVTAIRVLAASAATAVAFFVIFFILISLAYLAGLAPIEIPNKLIPVFVLLTIGIPLVLAARIGLLFHRRGWLPITPPSRWRRCLVVCVVATYFVTAVFGIPAVQTYTNAWAVDEYKRLKATGSTRVWEDHPYVATYAALPIAPGVVFVYHEYQLDGLYGFGGFELFVWYGAGVKRIASLPIWMS